MSEKEDKYIESVDYEVGATKDPTDEKTPKDDVADLPDDCLAGGSTVVSVRSDSDDKLDTKSENACDINMIPLKEKSDDNDIVESNPSVVPDKGDMLNNDSASDHGHVQDQVESDPAGSVGLTVASVGLRDSVSVSGTTDEVSMVSASRPTDKTQTNGSAAGNGDETEDVALSPGENVNVLPRVEVKENTFDIVKPDGSDISAQNSNLVDKTCGKIVESGDASFAEKKSIGKMTGVTQDCDSKRTECIEPKCSDTTTEKLKILDAVGVVGRNNKQLEPMPSTSQAGNESVALRRSQRNRLSTKNNSEAKISSTPGPATAVKPLGINLCFQLITKDGKTTLVPMANSPAKVDGTPMKTPPVTTSSSTPNLKAGPSTTTANDSVSDKVPDKTNLKPILPKPPQIEVARPAMSAAPARPPTVLSLAWPGNDKRCLFCGPIRGATSDGRLYVSLQHDVDFRHLSYILQDLFPFNFVDFERHDRVVVCRSCLCQVKVLLKEKNETLKCQMEKLLTANHPRPELPKRHIPTTVPVILKINAAGQAMLVPANSQVSNVAASNVAASNVQTPNLKSTKPTLTSTPHINIDPKSAMPNSATGKYRSILKSASGTKQLNVSTTTQTPIQLEKPKVAQPTLPPPKCSSGCVFCGVDGWKKKRIYNFYEEVDGLPLTKILSDLFPYKFYDMAKDGSCPFICNLCYTRVENLRKKMKVANAIQRSMLKSLKRHYPGAVPTNAENIHEGTKEANTKRVSCTPDSYTGYVHGGSNTRMLLVRSTGSQANCSVKHEDKSTQTRLSIECSRKSIPESLLVTTLTASVHSTSDIQASVQRYCANNGKEEIGLSLVPKRPAASDAESTLGNASSDHVPSKQVVLVQLPKPHSTTVSTQTVWNPSYSKDALSKCTLGSVFAQKGSADSDTVDVFDMNNTETKYYVDGQCIVCGAVPSIGHSHIKLSRCPGAIQFLLQYCGVFLLKNSSMEICYDCRDRVNNFHAGVKFLSSQCRQNAPSVRELGSKSRKVQVQKKFLSSEIKPATTGIVAQRVSDIVQNDELRLEHGYFDPKGKLHLPTRGKKRKVKDPVMHISMPTEQCTAPSTIATSKKNTIEVVRASKQRKVEQIEFTGKTSHLGNSSMTLVTKDEDDKLPDLLPTFQGFH